MTPPPRRTKQARAAYDRAYARLIEAIRADLADGSTVTSAAEATGWSREYIGQIRDGKAGDAGPKRSRKPPAT